MLKETAYLNIQMENSSFKLQYFTVFPTVFFRSNKCSFGEHKRLIKKIKNIRKSYRPQTFVG